MNYPAFSQVLPVQSDKIPYDVGIPMPVIQGRAAVYPFAEMPVGASFFVAKKASTLAPTVAAAKARTGHKFSVRTVTEGGVKGARVWRVA